MIPTWLKTLFSRKPVPAPAPVPTIRDVFQGYCTMCRFQIRNFEGVNACPNCGTTSTPCSHEHDVLININWHELRVLCMGAEWHGRRIEKQGLIYSIAGQIAEQHPELAEDFPLTFAGEIANLKKEFPDVIVLDGNGEEDRSFE